ncbi:hypothetical protein B5M43_009080 [Microbacterium sp. MEC084]|uniref:hypothetical protein n=1 Tax=Microbacterium sp. MEC084 TaxID=1963027 RepID=UPI00106F190F|nr:hypothetical protein [Microbacterium sp. MEC084]MCD1268990.1 hypothetical protein [Microbacterium sp. MEC084]
MTGDGDWQVKVQPLEQAPLVGPGGVGDEVYLYGGGDAQVSFFHRGLAEYMIVQWKGTAPAGSRLVLGGSGPISTAGYSLSAGPSVLYVTATGLWALTPR